MRRLHRIRSVALVAFTVTGLGAGLANRAAAGPPPPPPSSNSDIVVKIDLSSGASLASVTSAYPVTVESALLASRGIYLLRCTTAECSTKPDKVRAMADKISHAHGVIYAEVDTNVSVADAQFHSWPYGLPSPAGRRPYAWTHQAALAGLRLSDAHQLSTGAGAVVAVLDTGIDADQRVLAGRVLPGWNYVDDNADVSDVSSGLDDNGDGVVDGAAGHGTFVSGLVSLVAPGARILPERVLDSDGAGNVFIVAQAILDAVDAGVDVINISFGTATRDNSRLIDDALRIAANHQVVVVAAAGNDASDVPHYPAADPGVLGVGALDDFASRSLSSYSDWGPWVAVCAPGDDLIGPVPGNRFATWSGTSMATPLVSGQVALLRSAAPLRAVGATEDAVRHTALAVPNHRIHFGAIDVVSSLHTLLAAH